MTGASYAAITYGPQLYNYKYLIDPTKEANPSNSEPLNDEEIRILKKIVETFPEKQMVYDAAHRERVWKEATVRSCDT